MPVTLLELAEELPENRQLGGQGGVSQVCDRHPGARTPILIALW